MIASLARIVRLSRLYFVFEEVRPIYLAFYVIVYVIDTPKCAKTSLD